VAVAVYIVYLLAARVVTVVAVMVHHLRVMTSQQVWKRELQILAVVVAVSTILMEQVF
jgi:hypothetical protein